jgi:hypothetical protein
MVCKPVEIAAPSLERVRDVSSMLAELDVVRFDRTLLAARDEIGPEIPAIPSTRDDFASGSTTGMSYPQSPTGEFDCLVDSIADWRQRISTTMLRSLERCRRSPAGSSRIRTPSWFSDLRQSTHEHARDRRTAERCPDRPALPLVSRSRRTAPSCCRCGATAVRCESFTGSDCETAGQASGADRAAF